jgi:phosphoadenosine phosphosulfate reductase
MTADLQKKVNFAIKLLQSAEKMAAQVGQPLEIAYSGGKDSDVILELARMAGVKYRAIYKNTTIDPPGTIKHAQERGVEVIRPKRTFAQVIEAAGIPSRSHRVCCAHLKEYKILDHAVIGVRRDESRKRKERYKMPDECRVYNKKNDIRAHHYFPILTWTAEDVAAFLQERGVKAHPLYYDEHGNFHPERRLGCMCCPLMSKKKRIADFKAHPQMVRFYIKAAQRYVDKHPVSKMTKLFKGNVYDWFTSQIFCEGEREFRFRFGPSLFEPNGTDCKQFIEQYFNIKL